MKIRGNKKGQVPGTSKKTKSETRGKNGQVFDSRIRGTRYPLERKEKRKYRASYSPQKASKCKKAMYPLKGAKVELDFYHHHHTPFTRHTCTSVGYFKRKQKNPQAHGYRCSLHP